MDDGTTQYMANLEATQRRDHADKHIIDQYTRLADRMVAAETSRRELESELRRAPVAYLSSKGKSPTPPKGTSSPVPSSDASAQLRTQLGEAQKARALLEAEVSIIPGLQEDRTAQAKAIVQKDREIVYLQRKLRDQIEEMKQKKSLVEQVQDDMITLNLQVNIAEQKADKLQRDNDELTQRWMDKMREEADQMNEKHKW